MIDKAAYDDKMKEIAMRNRLYWLMHLTLNGTEAEQAEGFRRMYRTPEPQTLTPEVCNG